MAAIETIRRENLARLVSGFDSQLAFATRVGLSGQYLNQLLVGRRNIGEKAARKIEATLQLDSGALDREFGAEHEAPTPTQNLPIEQAMLLSDYEQLSPKHRTTVRELVAMFAKIDHLA